MDASLEMMVALMIILGLITLALVGYLVWAMRKNKKSKARRTEQHQSHGAGERSPVDAGSPLEKGEATMSVPVAVPGRAEKPIPTAAPDSPARETESLPEPDGVLLMRVWQDDDGVLLVDVDGERYRRLYDIRDGAVGRKVLDTIHRLVAFSKGQESRATPTMQPPKPADARSYGDTAVDEPSEPVLASLRDESATAARRQRLTMDPIPFRRRSDILQPGITLDLAAEVDKFLQMRLSASPQFARRYIHVTGSPDGSLRFHVDGARYDALDAVPDKHVQAVMRAAIADWEAKR